ncbi:MAG: glycosyltransferase family 2 protein [Methanobacterium sp.]|nr:glycosyltransferase family 2 protein [Methanobacterium sp.]
MNNKTPRVSIIILNWNGWKDTLECLESIFQIKYPNYDVIVVDNASQDDSVNQIKRYAQGFLTVESDFIKYSSLNKPMKVFEFSEEEYFILENKGVDFTHISSGKKIIILKNKKNYGYAQGNNLAINFAMKNLQCDYILILNNDTVVHKYLLQEMVDTAIINEKAGAITPKVYYYDYNGRQDVISHAGEKFNLYIGRGKRCGKDQIDNGQCDQTRKVDTIEGCSILLKTEILQEVGLFDPLYFAYWEDTDLSFRIRQQGYELLYVPQAMIWHKIGVSWDSYFSYFVIYHYLVRNRLIFMWRFASALQKTTFTIFFIFYLILNVLIMVFKEDLTNSKKGFQGIIHGILDFRKVKHDRDFL